MRAYRDDTGQSRTLHAGRHDEQQYGVKSQILNKTGSALVHTQLLDTDHIYKNTFIL